MSGRTPNMLVRLLGLRERWRDLHLELSRTSRLAAELSLRLTLMESHASDSKIWRGAEDAHRILRALEPVGSAHDFRRVGSAHDGGYVIAADLQLPAIVMSVGVGSNDSADRDLADEGCFVHQFDHTVKSSPGGAHQRIAFHRLGIGGKDCTHPLRPLIGLEAEAGGIDDGWLMIDVEGAEWGMLHDETASLARYAQISIELHGLLGLLQADLRGQMTRALDRLRRDHVVIANHVNNYGAFVQVGSLSFPDVIELTLVRRDRFRSGSSLPPARLFAANNPGGPAFGEPGTGTDGLAVQLHRLSPYLSTIAAAATPSGA